MGIERGWEIKQEFYADDAVLVAETREHLQRIVNGNEIGRESGKER